MVTMMNINRKLQRYCLYGIAFIGAFVLGCHVGVRSVIDLLEDAKDIAVKDGVLSVTKGSS